MAYNQSHPPEIEVRQQVLNDQTALKDQIKIFRQEAADINSNSFDCMTETHKRIESIKTEILYIIN